MILTHNSQGSNTYLGGDRLEAEREIENSEFEIQNLELEMAFQQCCQEGILNSKFEI
jgi:hypothetical protein